MRTAPMANRQRNVSVIRGGLVMRKSGNINLPGLIEALDSSKGMLCPEDEQLNIAKRLG